MASYCTTKVFVQHRPHSIHPLQVPTLGFPVACGNSLEKKRQESGKKRE